MMNDEEIKKLIADCDQKRLQSFRLHYGHVTRPTKVQKFSRSKMDITCSNLDDVQKWLMDKKERDRAFLNEVKVWAAQKRTLPEQK